MTPVSVRCAVRAAILAGLSLGALAETATATVTVPSAQYPKIQSAINAVLNGGLPNGTTIDVQPGTYAEALVVGPSGKSFTVRGVGGPLVTIVDAAGRGAPARSCTEPGARRSRAGGDFPRRGRGCTARRAARAPPPGGDLARRP